MCEYVQVPCVHAQCGELVTRANLAEHLEKRCQYRMEKCEHCESPVVFAVMKVLPLLSNCNFLISTQLHLENLMVGLALLRYIATHIGVSGLRLRSSTSLYKKSDLKFNNSL